MSVLVRTAGVTVLGFAFVACGGGAGGDGGAIKDVFRDFFQAFEDEDAEALASLLSEDCENPDVLAAEAIDDFADSTLDVDVEFNITGADIRDLTETTAEALPEGTTTVGGQEFRLDDADDPEYASLTKEDGEWKLADCSILI